MGLESSSTAMIYANQLDAININNNIFWNEEMTANSMFIRYTLNMVDGNKGVGKDNIGNANKNFKTVFTDSNSNIVCPPTIINESEDFKKNDVFNTGDINSFDISKGIFIPNAPYKLYGAQR